YPPADAWSKTRIHIPSPWNINGFAAEEGGGNHRLYPSYPGEWEKAESGWHRTRFIIPESFRDKLIFLRFEAVNYYTEVYLNGRRVGSHETGFTPFQFEVGRFAKVGEENELLVGVAGWRDFMHEGRFTFPTGSFWGMHIKGIWQDVYLSAAPAVYIEDAYIITSVREHKIRVQTTIRNASAEPCRLTLRQEIRDWRRDGDGREESVKSLPETEVVLEPGTSRAYISEDAWADAVLWEPEHPHLYVLQSRLVMDGRPADELETRFGFREFWIEGNRFKLNGVTRNLRGDAWHYMGYAQQSREYAELWYKMARETNINVIRLHAMVYPSFYLDAADEAGMLIIDESAFWASNLRYFYNDDFRRRTSRHLEEWVKRDRNHPSVIIWSVENEALTAHYWLPDPGDGARTLDDFRETMRCLAAVIADLDPSRPISGDGDGDLLGLLPIFSLHYHGLLSTQGVTKPITFGESGGMFYAAPPDLSYLAGERVYESFAERMHAVGREMTSFIGERRTWASLITPFNVVWYALEPLPFKERYLAYADPGGPGVKPEKIGAYTSTLNPGLDPELPAWRPTALHPYLREALRPLRFFFHQHDTTFYGGAEVKRSFTVHNDTPEDKDLVFTWRLARSGGAGIFAAASVHISLAPAEYREIEIAVPCPAVGEPSAMDFTGELRADGAAVFSETRKWTIYPERIPLRAGHAAGGGIGVLGDDPRMAGVLARMGAAPRTLTRIEPKQLAGLRLLLIDLFTASLSPADQEAVREAVERGMRCLALGPASAMRGIFGQRLDIRPVREDWSHCLKTNAAVYPALPRLADGLSLDDLRYWAPDDLVSEDYTFGGVLPGNALPLLVDGYNEAVCLALYRGRGMILLCGMDLPRKQETVPAALVLFRNLLEYALAADSLPAARTGLLAPEDSELQRIMRILGADATLLAKGAGLDGCEVLVADGAMDPDSLPEPGLLGERIAEGRQLLIQNLTPETLPYYQRLLPGEIRLVPSAREEQIKVAPDDPLLAGFNNADLYWLERGSANPIVRYGVDVSRIPGAKVLTQTPITDWRAWVGRPEHLKTVMVLRSEREGAERVNGLVSIPLGQGRIIINQILTTSRHEKSRRILGLLLTNLGVPLAEHPADIDVWLDEDKYICHWLVLGPFPAEGMENPLDHDFLQGEAAAVPAAGKETAGRTWIEIAVEPHAPTLLLQDLLRPAADAVAYLAVYVHSPRDAEALLDSPQQFQADLLLETFNEYKVWLNNEEIGARDIYRVHAPGSERISRLKLRYGANLLLIKLHRGPEEWKLRARILDARTGRPVREMRYGKDPRDL
ncbi:MAG: sugar-binding domain-containing protein, partial [Bacteroidota bacterium]